MLFIGSDKESAEGFAVWCWNKQLFVVVKSKLGRAWDVGPRIRWKCSWVDELTDQVSGQLPWACGETYFCLKYRRPLQSAASPEEASSGIRKYDTSVSSAVPMVIDRI
jgi:hypothetical protein